MIADQRRAEPPALVSRAQLLSRRADQQRHAVGGQARRRTAQLRHFGAAPLIEDGSARSDPTTLINAGAYLTVGRGRLGVDLLSALDSKDSDIT